MEDPCIGKWLKSSGFASRNGGSCSKASREPLISVVLNPLNKFNRTVAPPKVSSKPRDDIEGPLGDTVQAWNLMKEVLGCFAP